MKFRVQFLCTNSIFSSNLAPIVVVVCLTSIIWGIQKTRSRFFKGNETCSIPSVPYNFSFIGNGLQFSVDMPGFLSSCYKKYGIIFKLKIFRFSTVIICDRDLAELFYKVTCNYKICITNYACGHTYQKL